MKSLPKFNLMQPVKVPTEVYEGKEQPYIVGVEAGEQNIRVKVKTNTYLYHVKLEPNQEWIFVTEEELTKWGN